jgi:hypothetical protein
MNFSLKALSRVALVATASVVASCAPTGPSSPQNDLAVSQKTISLSNTNLADTADVSLVCGCPYHMTVVKYEGDTTMIVYNVPTFATANGNAVSNFKVVVSGVPTAPTGTYTSQLILKGGEEGFLDTINTTYIVP